MSVAAHPWEVAPVPDTKAPDQLQKDRQVLTTLALGDEGWEILERVCAQVGSDPVRVALSAIARELVRTTNTVEQEAMPAIRIAGRVALGFPALTDEQRAEILMGRWERQSSC